MGDSKEAARQAVEDLEAEFGIGGEQAPPTVKDQIEKGKKPAATPIKPPKKGEPVVPETLNVKGLIGQISLVIRETSELKPSPGFRKVDTTDPDFLALVQSVKDNGLFTPILVKGNKVVSGRRRLAAAKAAGLKEIAAIQMSGLDDNAVMIISLLDNLQRKNLDPLEEAKALNLLLEKNVVKNQNKLAKMLGLTHARISQKLSVLELSPKLKKAMSADRISATAAVELKGAPEEVIDRILGEAKEAHKKVTVKKASAGKPPATRSAVGVILPEGTPVEVKSGRLTRGGVRLTIDVQHPNKVWKEGELSQILGEIAKDCGPLDKALTLARKELG